MQLILEGEQRIRLRAEGDGLDIESTDPQVMFSPLHMLAGSLATCTMAVLAGWAARAGVGIHDLEIELVWEYIENPYRVGSFDLTLYWPGLPAARQEAVLRVAQHCTVDHTLRHPPSISTRIAADL